MNFAEWMFWFCFALIVYTYLLYPLALIGICAARRLWGGVIVGRRKSRSAEQCSKPSELPSVSLLVPAYNEERDLPGKLTNLREIDYPSERLEVLIASDGSNDGTDGILSGIRQPGFRYFRLPRRQGKPAALNLVAEKATGDILVFSDAATLFAPDVIYKLTRHFSDGRVGVVCGALVFARSEESAATEGIYWRYETAMRRCESELGITLTASGAIYAIRRVAFRPLATNAILEDFLVPMMARRLGFRVIYDPEARARDTAPATVGGEFSRRTRLGAGSFQALGPLTRAALTSPALFWSFVSHKLFRWLAPFFLLGLAVASIALYAKPFAAFALVLQAMFYLWALFGLAWREHLQRVPGGLLAYFFVAMNLAFLVGLARMVTRRQPVTWMRVSG